MNMMTRDEAYRQGRIDSRDPGLNRDAFLSMEHGGRDLICAWQRGVDFEVMPYHERLLRRERTRWDI